MKKKIATVVSHLQGISLSGTDLDTKGVAFERFMEDFLKENKDNILRQEKLLNL